MEKPFQLRAGHWHTEGAPKPASAASREAATRSAHWTVPYSGPMKMPVRRSIPSAPGAPSMQRALAASHSAGQGFSSVKSMRSAPPACCTLALRRFSRVAVMRDAGTAGTTGRNAASRLQVDRQIGAERTRRRCCYLSINSMAANKHRIPNETSTFSQFHLCAPKPFRLPRLETPFQELGTKHPDTSAHTPGRAHRLANIADRFGL